MAARTVPVQPSIVRPPPVNHRRVADDVADKIRREILTGVYAPGEKLPPERNLAKTLGVNRASVREALKALEQLGLIVSRQGDGTRVLDYMQTAGIDLVSHLIPLAAIAGDAGPVGHDARAMLDEVLEFRSLWAREIARLAARRAEPADLDSLVAVSRRLDAKLTPEDRLRIDFDFYIALTQAAKNRVLALLINSMRAAVERYAELFAPLVDAAEVRAHHRTMLAALRARDEGAAVKAADAHTNRPPPWRLSAERS